SSAARFPSAWDVIAILGSLANGDTPITRWEANRPLRYIGFAARRPRRKWILAANGATTRKKRAPRVDANSPATLPTECLYRRVERGFAIRRLAFEIDTPHRHADQAANAGRRLRLENQGVVNPVLHDVQFLGSFGKTHADGIAARRQERHLEAEARLDRAAGRHRVVALDMREIGIVAKEILAQPILDVEADDRPRQPLPGNAANAQCHIFAAADRAQIVALLVEH